MVFKFLARSLIETLFEWLFLEQPPPKIKIQNINSSSFYIKPQPPPNEMWNTNRRVYIDVGKLKFLKFLIRGLKNFKIFNRLKRLKIKCSIKDDESFFKLFSRKKYCMLL